GKGGGGGGWRKEGGGGGGGGGGEGGGGGGRGGEGGEGGGRGGGGGGPAGTIQPPGPARGCVGRDRGRDESERQRAESQWIVAARPLCHLQYPVAYLSRLQTILPAARR